MASIQEDAWLYMCEWIWKVPDELPSPHNPVVGLRIVVRRTERWRPPSESLAAANRPSLLSWSTTEKVEDMVLVNWALTCWSKVCEHHCTHIEIKVQR